MRGAPGNRKAIVAFLLGLRDQFASGKSRIRCIFHKIDMDQRDLSADGTCKLTPDLGRPHRNRIIIHGYQNFSDAQRVLLATLTWLVLASVGLIQINSAHWKNLRERAVKDNRANACDILAVACVILPGLACSLALFASPERSAMRG